MARPVSRTLSYSAPVSRKRAERGKPERHTTEDVAKEALLAIRDRTVRMATAQVAEIMQGLVASPEGYVGGPMKLLDDEVGYTIRLRGAISTAIARCRENFACQCPECGAFTTELVAGLCWQCAKERRNV